MIHVDELPPMLLDERPFDFDEPGWIYEPKFKGYRLMAEFGDGKCELRVNGANATKWFPEVARSLAGVERGPYVADGEICVLDAFGRSDFEKLHERARHRCWYEGAAPVTYALFDLLVEHGVDITASPLQRRKAALALLFKAPRSNILPIGHLEEGGEQLFREAVHEFHLDGVIAKHLNSRYLPGVRTAEWVKVPMPRPRAA